MATKAKTAILPNQSKSWLDEALALGSQGPHCVIAEITPSDAEKLLERNTENRGVRPFKVRQLMADIQRGGFLFNGESIVVAASGELNDGQHRLQAVVETGKSIVSVVVFGVPRESRTTLDLGAARGAGDFLHFAGVLNANVCAAITRLLIAWEKGDGRNFDARRTMPVTEIIERALKDTKIHQAAALAAKWNPIAARLAPASTIGFCHLILSRIDPTGAHEYMERLVYGDLLKREDAIFVTREALQMHDGTDRQQRLTMILRGWNFHRTGEQATRMGVIGRGINPPELAT